MRAPRLETAAAMDELLRLLQEGIDRSTGTLTLPPRQLYRVDGLLARPDVEESLVYHEAIVDLLGSMVSADQQDRLNDLRYATAE
jgi:hypothetical protein